MNLAVLIPKVMPYKSIAEYYHLLFIGVAVTIILFVLRRNHWIFASLFLSALSLLLGWTAASAIFANVLFWLRFGSFFSIIHWVLAVGGCVVICHRFYSGTDRTCKRERFVFSISVAWAFFIFFGTTSIIT